MNKFISRLIKNQKGQSLVEFALVIPIFLMLSFMIIDLGWYGYNTIAFHYSYRQANSTSLSAKWQNAFRNLNVQDGQVEIPPYAVKEILVNGFRKNAVGISLENIDISNAKYTADVKNIDSIHMKGKMLEQADDVVTKKDSRDPNRKKIYDSNNNPIYDYDDFKSTNNLKTVDKVLRGKKQGESQLQPQMEYLKSQMGHHKNQMNFYDDMMKRYKDDDEKIEKFTELKNQNEAQYNNYSQQIKNIEDEISGLPSASRIVYGKFEGTYKYTFNTLTPIGKKFFGEKVTLSKDVSQLLVQNRHADWILDYAN